MFIAVEGGEGAGKTTFSQALTQKLNEIVGGKRQVILNREPGGNSVLGNLLREVILDPTLSKSPHAELFLFLASRAFNIDTVIAPALRRGDIVISDRWHDSTIVYQGIVGGLNVEYVKDQCYHIVGEPFHPNLTILIDILPEEGLTRKKKQKKLDRFEKESLDYHNKICQGFKDLAKEHPDRYLLINGKDPIQDSLDTVLKYIEPWLCALSPVGESS